MKPEFIVPDWPAPAPVRALSTTRVGGFSRPPWAGFNLGDHVGDDPLAVTANRRLLVNSAGLPDDPLWLKQVHGCSVQTGTRVKPSADACYSPERGKVCAVLTADCLPVLFCNQAGTAVAAAHAGWRGLAAGILEKTVASFDESPSRLLAWLGPAIGPAAFEVGAEVRQAFVQLQPESAMAFSPGQEGRWFADIYALARFRLSAAGVSQIYGGGYCTFTDEERFFSYRRDGVSGRMASLVWLSPDKNQ
ncbi:peptidoglycan editing factor PgeF [Thiolapillus sp.]